MKKKIIKLSGLLIVLSLCWFACETPDDNPFQETEPNNSFSQANALTLSETYDAKISPAEDQDYFRVTTNETVQLTVDGGATLELYVYIYDQNYDNIYGGDTGARGASLSETIDPADHDGTFYIMVESAYVDDIGNYTIKVQ